MPADVYKRQLKDNKLTISYDDGYSDVLTVNELTATKLVLAFEDWDTMDAVSYTHL